MDLDLSAEDVAFREEVRDFFRNDYPTHILEKVEAGWHLTRED